MNKIRKGDEVVVIAGRDKGRRGTVVKILEGQLIVENVNMVKRHTKPNPQRNIKGGIIDQPAPLAIGKVMVVCPHCGKPTRVGRRHDEDVSERYCKQCNEPLVSEKQ